MEITCDRIQEMVESDDFEKLSRLLERPPQNVKDCPKLPNTIISMLRGYKDKCISEENVLDVFSILEKKQIMNPDFKDRVKSLEDFSELKEHLSPRILFELKKQY